MSSRTSRELITITYRRHGWKHATQRTYLQREAAVRYIEKLTSDDRQQWATLAMLEVRVSRVSVPKSYDVLAGRWPAGLEDEVREHREYRRTYWGES